MARPHCMALLQAQSAPWARARGRRGPVRPAAAQHHCWQGHPSGNVRGPGGRCPTEDLRGLPHRARPVSDVSSRGDKGKGASRKGVEPQPHSGLEGKGSCIGFLLVQSFQGPPSCPSPVPVTSPHPFHTCKSR